MRGLPLNISFDPYRGIGLGGNFGGQQLNFGLPLNGALPSFSIGHGRGGRYGRGGYGGYGGDMRFRGFGDYEQGWYGWNQERNGMSQRAWDWKNRHHPDSPYYRPERDPNNQQRYFPGDPYGQYPYRQPYRQPTPHGYEPRTEAPDAPRDPRYAERDGAEPAPTPTPRPEQPQGWG